MNFRSVTIWITVYAICGIAAFVVFQCGLGVFILGPLCFFPLLGNLLLAYNLKTNWSQIIVAMSTLFFGFCVAYEINNAFFVNPDAQSGLVLLFVGIAYLPLMIPFWLVAWIVEAVMMYRIKKKENSNNNSRKGA